MKKKNESGAIMVEASISLVAFMFLIVTILTVVNICIAQARIGCAINATAKEISQYSYLYGLTNLNEKRANIAGQGETAKDNINETIEATKGIFNAIEGMATTAKFADYTNPASYEGFAKQMKSGVGDIKNNAGQIKSVAEQIKKDPKAFIFSIASLAGSEGLEFAASSVIAAPICGAMVQKHLKNSEDQDLGTFLESLRIVPDASGSYVGGLDFSDSTLFLYGSDKISIIVKYKIKLITLLPVQKEFSFRQQAVPKGWLGGNEGGTDESEKILKTLLVNY